MSRSESSSRRPDSVDGTAIAIGSDHRRGGRGGDTAQGAPLLPAASDDAAFTASLASLAAAAAGAQLRGGDIDVAGSGGSAPSAGECADQGATAAPARGRDCSSCRRCETMICSGMIQTTAIGDGGG